MLPILAPAAATAGRALVAGTAQAVGRTIAAGVGGVARGAASAVGTQLGAAGVSLLSQGAMAGRGRNNRDDDIIEGEFTPVESEPQVERQTQAGGGGGRDIVPRGSTEVVPIEPDRPSADSGNNFPAVIEVLDRIATNTSNLPAVIEAEPVQAEQDISPAERLLDVLDRIDTNTAQTAAGVERLVDMKEDQPLEGPTDTANDPNAGGDDKPKEQESAISNVFKSIKKFLGKIGMLFIAAGLLVGGILSGGAGDFFEKLKEGFNRLVEALAPIIQVLFETVMPVVFDVMGKLVDAFATIVEVLAPILKTIIETVLPPVLKTIGLLVEVFTKIVKFLSPVMAFIAEAVAEAFAAVLAVVNGVLKFLTDPIGYIQDGLSYLADGGDRIIAGFADMINGIVDFIADIVAKFSESKAEALRSVKVEFGDEARARMDQREQERQAREAARNGEEAPALEDEPPVENVTQTDTNESGKNIEASQYNRQRRRGRTTDPTVDPEDVERLQESQQQTTRAARRRGRGATRVETNAGPALVETDQDAAKVDPTTEIINIIRSKDPQVKDGVVTIVKGVGRSKRRAALRASDLEGHGFTPEEVTAAMTAAGATPSKTSPGLFETESQVMLEPTSAQQESGERMSLATTETQQATEAATAAAAGAGANIVAPMNNSNVQNINSSTSTGVIYTGERDSLGGRSRVLPGVG